ncbi:MAG: hypothetical protein HIU92_18555 [Proteobacteria bacterium]|nr:hypothetical protein [Pseudomonadota bacterium]
MKPPMLEFAAIQDETTQTRSAGSSGLVAWSVKMAGRNATAAQDIEGPVAEEGGIARLLLLGGRSIILPGLIGPAGRRRMEVRPRGQSSRPHIVGAPDV